MSNKSSNDDWQEWRKLVLKSLEDLEDKFKELQDKVQELKTELAILNTKIMMYSVIAAFLISSVVTGVINLFLVT